VIKVERAESELLPKHKNSKTVLNVGRGFGAPTGVAGTCGDFIINKIYPQDAYQNIGRQLNGVRWSGILTFDRSMVQLAICNFKNMLRLCVTGS